MPLPLMVLPLSFAQSNDIEFLIDIIIIVGFIVVILGGWAIYAASRKTYICKECGEIIRTHIKVENCHVCGARIKE